MQGILISIAGTKGGVGKTLTLAHFLKILEEMDKKVAVISTDSACELAFLLASNKKNGVLPTTSQNFDYIKLPSSDHLSYLKSKYDVILYEVSNHEEPTQRLTMERSDTNILVGSSEPASNFLLKTYFSEILKNNPQHFHIVFNRLTFAKEHELLVKNMKDWGIEGHLPLMTSYIPEDQTLLDDLMRRDVFHDNYLKRISGQSWRRLLESILRQQNFNQYTGSKAA